MRNNTLKCTLSNVQSQPCFSEADLISNQNLLSNAAINHFRKKKDLSKVNQIQDQIKGAYFKTQNQSEFKANIQKQTGTSSAASTNFYYTQTGLQTNGKKIAQSGFFQTYKAPKGQNICSPSLSHSNQQQKQTEILTPNAGNFDKIDYLNPDAAKTAKPHFRRKRVQSSGKSRASSAGSSNLNQGSTFKSHTTKEELNTKDKVSNWASSGVIQVPENCTQPQKKVQSRKRSLLKEIGKESNESKTSKTISPINDVQRQKQQYPVPLPPSQLLKNQNQNSKQTTSKKNTPRLRNNKSKSANKSLNGVLLCPEQNGDQFQRVKNINLGRGSPNLQQLAKIIIDSKPQAILNPNQFEIFQTSCSDEKKLAQTKSQGTILQNSTQFKGFQQACLNEEQKQKFKKSSERIIKETKPAFAQQCNRKNSNEIVSHVVSNRITNDKIKRNDKIKSRSRSNKRHTKSGSDRKKQNKSQRHKEVEENEKKAQTINAMKTAASIDDLRQTISNQNGSSLKNFAAYRARLFNKQRNMTNTQKILISQTLKKSIGSTLYTPSATLQRTQQLALSHFKSMSQTGQAENTNISPCETKQMLSDKKPSQKSQRPYDLYKNASSAITNQQRRTRSNGDDNKSNHSNQMNGKKQVVQAVCNQQQRSNSNRSQSRKNRRDYRKKLEQNKKEALLAVKGLRSLNAVQTIFNGKKNNHNEQEILELHQVNVQINKKQVTAKSNPSSKQSSHYSKSKSKSHESKTRSQTLPVKEKLSSMQKKSQELLQAEDSQNDGPRFQFTMRQLENIVNSSQQITQNMQQISQKEIKAQFELNGVKQSMKSFSQDPYISIEPQNHKFFEKQVDDSSQKSIDMQEPNPTRKLQVKQLTTIQKLQKNLKNGKNNLLSLVELQKMRAQRMKELRRNGALIKIKNAAIIKIQTWFRKLLRLKQLRAQVSTEPIINFQQIVKQESKGFEQLQASMKNEPVSEDFKSSQVSSTIRVQNLIKQKIELRQKAAEIDSFQMQSQISREANVKDLKKQISEEYLLKGLMREDYIDQQESQPQAQIKQILEADQSKRNATGLILVGQTQLDLLGNKVLQKAGSQTSRSGKMGFPIVAGIQRFGAVEIANDQSASITLSRIMLEESMQIYEQKESPLRNKRLQLNINNEKTLEELKVLDVATNTLSPIFQKSNSPIRQDTSQREGIEELKFLSNRTQSEVKNYTSDKILKRYEEKFPTHQQIFRVDSIKSLQASTSQNRNYEHYCQPNSSSRASKLLQHCSSNNSILAKSQQSQTGLIGSLKNQDSLIAQKLQFENDIRNQEIEVGYKLTQSLLSPFTDQRAISLHVEDQQNDSQLSFQNEDSKSRSYSEAPFEKSRHEVLRQSQATETDEQIQQAPPDQIQLREREQSLQSTPRSSGTKSSCQQAQLEMFNMLHTESLGSQICPATEYQQIASLRDPVHTQANSVHYGVTVSQRNSSQATSNVTEPSLNSNSFNDSAAPCSGAINSRSGRSPNAIPEQHMHQLKTQDFVFQTNLAIDEVYQQTERYENFIKHSDQKNEQILLQPPENSPSQTPEGYSRAAIGQAVSYLKSVDTSIECAVSYLEDEKSQNQSFQRKQGLDFEVLNEFKRSNELASKKLEIQNQVFEMLLNEIKLDLFPIRRPFLQLPSESQSSNDISEETALEQEVRIGDSASSKTQSLTFSKPEFKDQDTLKQIKVDEKSISLKSNAQQTKTTKESKKINDKAARARKHARSKTMPMIKFNKNGKPAQVSFDRFSIGHKFFTELKQEKHKISASCEFDKFITNYFSVSSKISTQSVSNKTEWDEKKLPQAIRSFQFHQIEVSKQEQLDQFTKQIFANEKEQKSKMARKKLGSLSLCQDKKTNQNESEEALMLNLRGIKTSTDVAEQYIDNLFECLLQNEQEFLDSLATPFVSNPLIEICTIEKKTRQAKIIDQKLQERKDRLLPKLFSLAKEGSQSSSLQTTPKHTLSYEDIPDDSSEEVKTQQQPVLSVEMYLDIERKKEYVLLADSISEIDDSEAAENTKPELIEQQSMLAEWENIHNKVIFDAVNDALDEFRPYGLRGPPAPWSGQTRALTYRFSQNAREVLTQVREKVLGLSKTFGGALANSELLKEYHIRGPLEPDKLAMLREERLAIMMMQDCEETQREWEDLEGPETGIKLEVADMIMNYLAEELVLEMQILGNNN